MSTKTDTPEVKWVPTHKKLKNGETVYTGDQGEWDMYAESPPGPKKEKSAADKSRLKIAPDNDAATINYRDITGQKKVNSGGVLCRD